MTQSRVRKDERRTGRLAEAPKEVRPPQRGAGLLAAEEARYAEDPDREDLRAVGAVPLMLRYGFAEGLRSGEQSLPDRRSYFGGVWSSCWAEQPRASCVATG